MNIQSCCLSLATLLLVAGPAALPAAAQATPTSGPTSTVVYAGGDDLVLKASDGKLLNFTIPPGYKFTSGNKQLGLSELKPGTKLTKPVAPGSVPQVVSSVAVVKAKVFAATPPDAVTLSLPEGTKDVAVPAGTTFMVDGKKLPINDVKPNMMVEATIITTAAAGDPAPATAPDTPPMAGALLVAHTSGEGDLPAAGTSLPLFGALGLVCLSLGVALLSFRKRSARVERARVPPRA
jgi:LPXTG-motif cell wall-anchored protein